MSATAGLSPEDIGHLETLERGPFDPIGWLYERSFQSLADRGLAYRRRDGFRLTAFGAEELKRARDAQPTPWVYDRNAEWDST